MTRKEIGKEEKLGNRIYMYWEREEDAMERVNGHIDIMQDKYKENLSVDKKQWKRYRQMYGYRLSVREEQF